MSTTKVTDSMRDVTVVDGTKVSGAVPAAALSNVDLVEGTKGVDIASAGTIVIGTDGGYFDITGTTGVSTMTVAAGRVFTLQFDGIVTLTHSSTLYLSGATNFTTEANDHMTFISVAANDVRQIGTGLKDGGSPVAAAGGVDGITSSANATAITISADEQVQMPLQPCFNVKLNATVTNVTGAGTSYTIAFDTEIFDIGSNFNTSTYKFTAPITGRYLLAFNIGFIHNSSYTADYWSATLVTSNRNYTNWFVDDNFTHRDWSSSLCIITDMDASDTAHIVVGVAGVSSDSVKIEGSGYTSFSGVLLT